MWQENELKLFHEALANLLSIKNPGNSEIENWLEAKQDVGYILGDEIIQYCKNNRGKENKSFQIPYNYCDYLNSISIGDFKKKKAYFIWEKRGRHIDNDKSRKEQDELDAFCEIEFLSLINCNCRNKCVFDWSSVDNYIADINPEELDKIKRLKALWHSFKTPDFNPNKDWIVAEEYANNFYSDIKSVGKKPNQAYKLIDENQDIVSVFEYCTRCNYILKPCNLKIMKDSGGKKQYLPI